MAMRWARLLAALVPLMFAAANVYAAEQRTSPPTDQAQSAAKTRVALFEALATAKTEADTREIEQHIWELRLRALDPESQRLFDASKAAQIEFDYRGALQALGRLIERAPTYAEDWNQRASCCS